MPTRIFIRAPRNDTNINSIRSFSPPSRPQSPTLSPPQSIVSTTSTTAAAAAAAATTKIVSNRSRNRNRNNRTFRRRRPISLSSKDISASSRLSGYLFIFTAYVVLFVSSFNYEPENNTNANNTNNANNANDANENENNYYDYSLPEIVEWKRQSAIIGSASFASLMLFIVIIHFDTICAPNLWLSIFKDGSIYEALLLISLFLAAIFMVFVSTSMNGIGGYAGGGNNYNVYFSSWIGFFACAHTFGLWKTSTRTLSNLSNINHMNNQNLMTSTSFPETPFTPSSTSSSPQRKTNKAWAWTLFFSLVTFFSVLDVFLVVSLYSDTITEEEGSSSTTTSSSSSSSSSSSAPTSIGENQLALMLLSSSISVLCCFIVLIVNILCSCCDTNRNNDNNHNNHNNSQVNRFNFHRHWYKIEGALLILLIGFWSWAVFRFTGINGLVNGPSNSYFGVWGCFFCSISIFGPWKTEYRMVN